MSENVFDQLDQAVTDMLTRRDVSTPTNELASLLEVAVALRGLPREEFRMKLQRELITQTSKSVGEKESLQFREDFHTVTPYLAVKEVEGLIEFVKQAFGARGAVFGIGSEGGVHAEYKIGDSMVMIGGGAKWRGEPKLAGLHLYVDDVDSTYERALAAGATSLTKPLEDHGERVACVKDPTGNEWYIAKRLTGSHTDEGLRTVTVYFHPQGAARMIAFLKEAFAAKEEVVYRESAQGPVVHAKIRIGDSIIEMGEAHDQWQPMTSMLYLYVDNVDAWYERAIAGGAITASEPADQPYGDRVASVNDPFGNLWYLSTPIKAA